MYEKAKELGFIPYVGEGTAIFNALHVKDIARFMLLVLSKALEEGVKGSVYERCFITGGEDMQSKTAAEGFAKALQRLCMRLE
jgi:nucleoside-diphosphate-sugar epimerase